MATLAERFRADEERRHPVRKGKVEGKGKGRRGASKPVARKVAPKKGAKPRRGRSATRPPAKATHALEQTRAGKRPSRKSTRSSANRIKPDAPFNLTEQKRRGSPEAIASRARAKRTTVRGRGRRDA